MRESNLKPHRRSHSSKLRVIISVAAVISCMAVGWILFLAAWDWSLTTERMTVLVNDVDHVGEAECEWSGSQYFDVNLREVAARFRVMLFKSEQKMNALIHAREAAQLETDSIELRLIYKDASGNDRDIPLAPRHPTLTKQSGDGQVRSWFQDFTIGENLTELTEGSFRLLLIMDYQDAQGKLQHLSLTIPLRKEEIVVPSSIVQLNDLNPLQLNDSLAIVQ